jgi:hypothetical protein
LEKVAELARDWFIARPGPIATDDRSDTEKAPR